MFFYHLRTGTSLLAIVIFAAFLFVSPARAARIPAVSVTAADASASENAPDKGSFVFKRDCCTNAPLTVYFKISGTAANGADYASLPLNVTIPAAAATVTLNVVPFDDSIVETVETVTVTIVSGAGYKPVSPSSATVTISDNDAPPQPAPSGLAAGNITTNSLDLSWVRNSTTETGFVIEKSTNGGAFQTAGTVGAGASGFSVGALAAGTAYTFRVGALGGATPAYSNSITAMTENSANSLYVSTLGSDADSGGSPQAPLRTINAALARAAAGTTVYIEGGTYFEQVVSRFAGLPGQEITLAGYNGTATIDGANLSWTPGGNQNQGLVELRHAYLKLQNLRIVNSKNTGIILDADNLTIENCEIAETQRHAVSTDTRRQTNYPGMTGTMIGNIAIKNNLVYRAVLKGQGYGQAISLIADGFIVSGNTVRDNLTEGIDIWLGAKHGEVVDNVVYGNARPGIYIDGASYVRVHRNRVYGNLKGIGVTSEEVNYSTSYIWVYNNLVYDNADAGIFMWDDAANPGFPGAQNVLLANNTLVNNKLSIYLSGANNSAEIMNNAGYSSGAALYNSSTNSAFNIHHNVWLTGITGFVDAANKNFHLTAASPAVNAGTQIPLLIDDIGNSFVVDTDFDKLSRAAGSINDAGAYEFR
jgi:parallel beta-helix repeat protein